MGLVFSIPFDNRACVFCVMHGGITLSILPSDQLCSEASGLTSQHCSKHVLDCRIVLLRSSDEGRGAIAAVPHHTYAGVSKTSTWQWREVYQWRSMQNILFSVVVPQAAIDQFVIQHREMPRLFKWATNLDSIIAAVK
jgi:hypothetical protein